MVYITSDHAGFDLKLKLIESLNKDNVAATDLGPYELIPDDDYLDYISPVVKKVLEDESNVGILICKNGVGMCMAANKYKGIRATLTWNKNHAKSSKLDDNTNILTLPAAFISPEDAHEIAKSWVEAKFSREQRHIRRLEKVKELE